jgi:DNA-directed RNA polymerase
MVSKPIKTRLLKSSKPITISIPTEQYDYIAIERGFMANMIHSFDSSNIHILVKDLMDNNQCNANLYTIHDCFASSSGEIALIERFVRNAFASMYFHENYLKKFHAIIIDQIVSDEHVSLKEGEYYYKKDNETIKLKMPSLPNYN